MKKVFFEVKEKANRQSILKLFATLSFIFILLTLIIIEMNSPATGYEISIYSILPNLTWVFLILSIIIGMGIIAHQALTKNKSNFWFIGFLILIVVNFIILSLQIFRNYYLHSYSDPFAHLGISSSIASKGYFWQNYYPITHIIGAIFIEVCTLPPENVVKYLPIIFTMLSILFSYLLSTVVSFKRGQTIITAAASTILLFSYYHISVYPHSLSLLTFPLLFYLYFKASNEPSLTWKLALLVLLFLFPFFHPTPEVIIIFCLIMAEVVRWIWIKRTDYTKKTINITLNPALISLATFFLWISYFAVFGTSLNMIFKWTVGELPVLVRSYEIQPVIKQTSEKQIELLIKMYGHNLIFIVLSLIALLITIIYFFKRKQRGIDLFNMSTLFITSALAYLLLFTNIPYLPWGRMLGANVGIWATPVLVGFILYEMFKRYKKIGIIVIVAILSIASIISILCVYRSPWIYQPSWQITQMDLKGSNWYNSHENSDFQYGPLGWMGGYYHWYYHVPSHFGYLEYENIGDFIKKETYIVLTERFIQASSHPALKEWINISPSLARPDFNSKDFDMLKLDTSVNKLYSNKEFEVLLVIPNK